ncbi:50S ribosomal protein L32 [Candidatus Dojkabacteria bacterium]|nr:50S ribosomal protein L32 [Candidatus Dojkabacteria bacterium]
MAAVPKRKHSKRRKNIRRSHLAIKEPTLVKCPNCKHPMKPHHVCDNCGFYKGKEVIKVG